MVTLQSFAQLSILMSEIKERNDLTRKIKSAPCARQMSRGRVPNHINSYLLFVYLLYDMIVIQYELCTTFSFLPFRPDRLQLYTNVLTLLWLLCLLRYIILLYEKQSSKEISVSSSCLEVLRAGTVNKYFYLALHVLPHSSFFYLALQLSLMEFISSHITFSMQRQFALSLLQSLLNRIVTRNYNL